MSTISTSGPSGRKRGYDPIRTCGQRTSSSNVTKFGTTAARTSDAWKTWRKSDKYRQWNQAIAPLVAARRRALSLLGDREAVKVLFSDVAPQFVDRPGGYTRVLKLAKPRLGDAGTRAILEFVGVRDRVRQRSTKPSFETAKS